MPRPLRRTDPSQQRKITAHEPREIHTKIGRSPVGLLAFVAIMPAFRAALRSSVNLLPQFPSWLL
jgi:hypothetical protein